MKRLAWELKELVFHNRDGSYSTQRQRLANLLLFAKQLEDAGYRGMRAVSLQRKHVNALLDIWRREPSRRSGGPLSGATLKNRLCMVRWWAKKINKPGVVPKTNTELGIHRRYSDRKPKAIELDPAVLNKITDPYVAMSVKLQRAFALRREEAMKIQPDVADHGDRLVLKASWCKGGRQRWVPITNNHQRQLLDEAQILAKGGSLIPKNKSYRQQLSRFEHQTHNAGIGNTHGLRHRCAQDWYREMTGWAAPADGGPPKATLKDEQCRADTAARQQIAYRLGHSRIDVTNAYLWY